jgi:transposase-like protein
MSTLSSTQIQGPPPALTLSRANSLAASQSGDPIPLPLTPELDCFERATFSVENNDDLSDWDTILAQIIQPDARKPNNDTDWDARSLSESLAESMQDLDDQDLDELLTQLSEQEPVSPPSSGHSSPSFTVSSPNPSTDASLSDHEKPKPRRSYSEDFKQQVREYVAANPQKRLKELALKWNVPLSTMGAWVPPRQSAHLEAVPTGERDSFSGVADLDNIPMTQKATHRHSSAQNPFQTTTNPDYQTVGK